MTKPKRKPMLSEEIEMLQEEIRSLRRDKMLLEEKLAVAHGDIENLRAAASRSLIDFQQSQAQRNGAWK